MKPVLRTQRRRGPGETEKLTARKRFSQNFLVEPGYIRRIVETLCLTPTDRVVEIGPGRGAITEQLVASTARLTVIEIDWDLVRLLSERFPTLDIRSADALRLDFSELHPDVSRFRVVGNLPYNISTPLIFHLLQYGERIEDATFMLQDEVVDRLTAEPGTKKWGRLSVMVQYHCKVERLFQVPPTAFQPRPQVKSRIVRLQPWRCKPTTARCERALGQVVAAAFGQRRKTLRNALKSLPEDSAERMVDRVEIDWQARPETLDIDAFVRLADALAAVREARRPPTDGVPGS